MIPVLVHHTAGHREEHHGPQEERENVPRRGHVGINRDEGHQTQGQEEHEQRADESSLEIAKSDHDRVEDQEGSDEAKNRAEDHAIVFRSKLPISSIATHSEKNEDDRSQNEATYRDTCAPSHVSRTMQVLHHHLALLL